MISEKIRKRECLDRETRLRIFYFPWLFSVKILAADIHSTCAVCFFRKAFQRFFQRSTGFFASEENGRGIFFPSLAD